jgi:hypothetical protein
VALLGRGIVLAIKATVVIRRESTLDQRTGARNFHASVALLDEAGSAYGTPRYFGGFEQIGDLLKREAGVTHDQLQDRYPHYQRDEEVRISVSLEGEQAIGNLGFDLKEIKEEFTRKVQKRGAEIAKDKDPHRPQSEVDARLGDRFVNEIFKATPLGRIPDDKIIEDALFGPDES